MPTWENFFDPVLEKVLEKDIPALEKSLHKVTVFHYQENLKDKLELFCKIIVICCLLLIFTEILDPVLEFLLKMAILKLGTFPTSLI